MLFNLSKSLGNRRWREVLKQVLTWPVAILEPIKVTVRGMRERMAENKRRQVRGEMHTSVALEIRNKAMRTVQWLLDGADWTNVSEFVRSRPLLCPVFWLPLWLQLIRTVCQCLPGPRQNSRDKLLTSEKCMENIRIALEHAGYQLQSSRNLHHSYFTKVLRFSRLLICGADDEWGAQQFKLPQTVHVPS